MTKIVTSLASASKRGIFGIFKKAIVAAIAIGTAREVMVAQLPWGPVSTLTAFGSPAQFRATFYPDGFDHTTESYNSAVQFPHPDLWLVRVTGAGALAASGDLQTAVPANCVGVVAKYVGSGGNGIVCTVANASNGVANSFDLTVTKTNATTGKSTTEIYKNIDSTQPDGTYWTNITAKSVLLGALSKPGSGRPANGATTLAGGSDGAAVASSDYIGTPGSADKGIAVCEGDKTVSFVYCCDVPNSMLSTVNAGLTAHQAYMNDRRMVVCTGQAAETDSTAKTNAAALQGEMVAYVWPHGKVLDEDAVNDASPMITISLAAPFACLCALLQPHVSPATKRKDFTHALQAIKALDVQTGASQILDSLESNGVIAFEKNADGTFSPYSSICTDQTHYVWEARMKRFLMFSMGDALEEYRNAPNATPIQEDERTICSDFLDKMVGNLKRDPWFLPCLNDAGLLPSQATNAQADIDAGDYTIGFQAKLISEQKRIILAGEISTSTKVQVSVTSRGA